jgi:hypothetical protein
MDGQLPLELLCQNRDKLHAQRKSVTYALAAMLFHCLEKPILGLKNRFFHYKSETSDLAAPLARVSS